MSHLYQSNIDVRIETDEYIIEGTSEFLKIEMVPELELYAMDVTPVSRVVFEGEFAGTYTMTAKRGKGKMNVEVRKTVTLPDLSLQQITAAAERLGIPAHAVIRQGVGKEVDFVWEEQA